MDKKKTEILVIEDDEFLVKMYKSGLAREGLDVMTAGDGEAGFKLAKDKKPDLILLDLILPKLDGFATLERLKSESATSKIPILILSNLGQESDIKRGMDLGAKDYLIKTAYTVRQISEKIKKILNTA